MPGTIIADQPKVVLYVGTSFTSQMVVRIRTRQVPTIVHGYLARAHACKYAEMVAHGGGLFGTIIVTKILV